MAYADDITSTRTSTAKKYILPYLHKVFAWTKQNNLTLNPDKTTCTLFMPDPAEYKSNLDLKIHNIALTMATHPNVLGLTIDPKLTYSTHIHNISVHAHTLLQIIKALTATGWGKQNETLMATYKPVMRPPLENASSIWLLLLCLTTPLTLVCGGSPIIPLLVHQPAYLSIWPATPSLQRSLSRNLGVTVWCVCECSRRDGVCGCCRGGIVVMAVICRRLCVSMI